MINFKLFVKNYLTKQNDCGIMQQNRMIGEDIMNILTNYGMTLINYNNVTSLKMYQTDNGLWRIKATYSDGSYETITNPCDEQECQNAFNRLCDKITSCREHDTIDLEDLWD